MITNHWGIYVDNDKPITGVLTNNQAAQFISDEIQSNGIDLIFDNHRKSADHDKEDCQICESWEGYNTDYLIGDWLIDNDGLYYPNPSGEYSAIVGEIYTQVVYSTNTKRCALCSPCYPGQADLDSIGDFLAYDLPIGAYDY